MIRPLLVAIALSTTATLQAQEKFDYPGTLALAVERTQSKPPGEMIYVVGPEQTEEFYWKGGEEKKRTVPYFRSALAKDGTTVGATFNLPQTSGFLGRSPDYQVIIYRANSPDPILRVPGGVDQFRLCQFPLKGGDILVISSTKK